MLEILSAPEDRIIPLALPFIDDSGLGIKTPGRVDAGRKDLISLSASGFPDEEGEP
jgi:hypothetical protein